MYRKYFPNGFVPVNGYNIYSTCFSWFCTPNRYVLFFENTQSCSIYRGNYCLSVVLLAYITPIKFHLPLGSELGTEIIGGAKIKGSKLGTEIMGGAKIKGSELGTENRGGDRKLKGVNWSPKFEKFEKLC